MRFGISVRGKSDVCMEPRGLPTSQVAVESDLHEEPASIPDSSVAHSRGGFPNLNASKDRSSLQVECRNLQVERKIIGVTMSTGCVQQSTGSLQCLHVECSEQLIDNKR